MLITRTLLLTMCLSVTSCGMFQQIATKGAEASDDVLRDAIWVICNASPVGAVKRKFDTPELVQAYNTLCVSQEQLP